MAVTQAAFLASYPEFNPASTELLAAKLAAAELQVDADVWGGKADLAVMLTAAHLLAISPFGQRARLVSDAGKTTYEGELSRMKKTVGFGFRVIR